jgi:hypothetical protein
MALTPEKVAYAEQDLEFIDDIANQPSGTATNRVGTALKTVGQVIADLAEQDIGTGAAALINSRIDGIETELDGKASAAQGSLADTAVQPAELDAETAARIAADNAESEARIAADEAEVIARNTAISNSVGPVSAALADEIENRIAGDQNEANARDAAIANYVAPIIDEVNQRLRIDSKVVPTDMGGTLPRNTGYMSPADLKTFMVRADRPWTPGFPWCVLSLKTCSTSLAVATLSICRSLLCSCIRQFWI